MHGDVSGEGAGQIDAGGQVVQRDECAGRAGPMAAHPGRRTLPPPHRGRPRALQSAAHPQPLLQVLLVHIYHLVIGVSSVLLLGHPVAALMCGSLPTRFNLAAFAIGRLWHV